MQEHSLAINYDLGVNTVTDCLPADTFDYVSALKKKSPNGPEMDVAPGDAELDARAQELSAIEDFIAKNGVSVPTARASNLKSNPGEVRNLKRQMVKSLKSAVVALVQSTPRP